MPDGFASALVTHCLGKPNITSWPISSSNIFAHPGWRTTVISRLSDVHMRASSTFA